MPIKKPIYKTVIFVYNTKANAEQIGGGALRIICALILSLFLAMHKVWRQKSAFVRTQILSQFALADLIIVC